VVAIPYRFQQCVGEAQEGHVQDGLLAQEVVDAKDLILFEHLVQFVVERACGGEVVAEGLLDHHRGPSGEVRLSKGRHDRREQCGWDLKVEQRPGGPFQFLGYRLVGGGVREVSLHVAETVSQPVEDLVFHRLSSRLDRLSG